MFKIGNLWEIIDVQIFVLLMVCSLAFLSWILIGVEFCKAW